jgi:hypothetical protein
LEKSDVFKIVHFPFALSSGLMFETIEGGFLDIDVRIVGPDGKIIYQGDRETNGKCK